MARNITFDFITPRHLETTMESPLDEDGLHDSFSRLIEEQSHGLDPGTVALEMEDLTDEQRDRLTYLRGAALEGRGQGRGRGREDSRVTDPLVEERWSSDTLRVLSSMPSRTIGRSRGAIISQYYNRTMQLRRRRQTRPAIRDLSRSARPSIRGYGMSDVSEEESKKDQLVNNLQNLSLSDRIRMLRAMPLSVAEKSELRRRVHNFKEGRPITSGQISCFSRLKYYFIIALRQGWYSWLSFLHALQPWHVALKRVSGRFGTGVVSYFDFLKTLLLFNVFLFLVYGCFLVIPQAIHPPSTHGTTPPFTGLELLTGAGSFNDTVMFYGHYSNHTLSAGSSSGCPPAHNATGHPAQPACTPRLSYNMPLAYFFTIGVSFFITCIILVYSMSKSFGRSFHISKSHGLAAKVFSSWDFKVIKRSSVKLQSENICTQLKEMLSEVSRREETKGLVHRLARLAVQATAWVMCLGSTVGCAFAVYHFSEYMHEDQKERARAPVPGPQEQVPGPQEQEASLLALPVVVSSFNLLLPGFFNTVGWMEEYDSISVRTYVAIFRNLLLKVSLLGVLCYHWLGRIAQNPEVLGLQCWESFVGQELYRFLLMDFIFILMDTFFGEFLWKLFSQKALKRKRKPEFDIARNVLELIYGQTLAWLGVLFSPLLPAVQIVKLLLLFYIKKASLMLNCQAPRRAWRASQMSTVFITLLCFPSFLGATVSVTYTIWMLRPSGACGPFRGLTTMFQAGKQWMQQLEQRSSNLGWVTWVLSSLLEKPLFLFIVAGVFLMVIYFHTQVLDGQRKVINLLQEQIENEGEDKKFLITRLQNLHEQRRPFSVHRRTERVKEEPA